MGTTITCMHTYLFEKRFTRRERSKNVFWLTLLLLSSRHAWFSMTIIIIIKDHHCHYQWRVIIIIIIKCAHISSGVECMHALLLLSGMGHSCIKYNTHYYTKSILFIFLPSWWL